MSIENNTEGSNGVELDNERNSEKKELKKKSENQKKESLKKKKEKGTIWKLKRVDLFSFLIGCLVVFASTFLVLLFFRPVIETKNNDYDMYDRPAKTKINDWVDGQEFDGILTKNPLGENYQPKTLVDTFSVAYTKHNLENPGLATDVYVHIVTPLKKENCMYKYEVDGYSYGGAKALDFVFVGYTYEDNKLHQVESIDRNKNMVGIKLEQYKVQDSLILKFGPVPSYYTHFGLYYSGHHQKVQDGIIGDYQVILTTDSSNIQHI